jgi:predicted ester cyclase
MAAPRGPEIIKENILIAEGDRVSSLLTFDGTHTGQWQGIPPSGKRINIHMMTIHRIWSGKIIEDWVIVESLGFSRLTPVISVVPRSTAPLP